MHFYKKINHFFFYCLLVFFAQITFAGSNSIQIRSADLVPADDYYALNADIDMKFSPKVEAAISKGFVLNFIIEFQLTRPRKYWFDDEVVTTSYGVALSYHALSRQFLVTRGDQQKAFLRLDEALDDMTYISGLNVIKKSEVDAEPGLKAALLMRLNTKKLPQALQADEEWNMSSQRFEWTPKFVVNSAKLATKPDIKLDSTK